MQKNKSLWFTLVELIVVITILAILWTIAFVSFQWYTISARDSVRVSDLGTIARWLDYFKLQEWYYPSPTDPYNVTFSWSLAWEQGTFWETTRQVIKRVSEIPVDPLTGNPYAYSVTNTKQEYELWSITEALIWSLKDENNSRDLFPSSSVYADNSFFTYIKWNYNRQIVTVKELTQIIILWVPTIITTEIETIDVRDILTKQSFAISWSKNLPASYSLSLPVWQTHTGSISFSAGPIATAPVLFEGSISELSLSDAKQTLGEKLKAYYADSNLWESQIYKSIWSLVDWQEYKYINSLIQSDTAGLSSNSVRISNETPTNVGLISGGWNIIHPSTCMEMTQENLDNLNNWMNIALYDGLGTGDDNFAFWKGWTSSLTLTQWCDVIAIDVEPNTVLSSIPQEVGYLYNLEFLSYGNQNINTIPETLTRLGNLKDIYLQGNQLWNLELSRFDWTDGYTCENGIWDNGSDMCIELVWWEGGEGWEPVDGGWDGWEVVLVAPEWDWGWSDGVRFVLKWPQHVFCAEVMTDTQLAELNSWGTAVLWNAWSQITIAPGWSSNLTKSQWCSIDTITNEVRGIPTFITYIPWALSQLPKLQAITLVNEDIWVLSNQFYLLSHLGYLNLTGNTQLWNLSTEFNLNTFELCSNVSNGSAPRNVCIWWGGGSNIQITDVNSL